jgi:AraC family transcriptional regulator of adaptative response / DNA-3-methyladenine glycosylase II
MSLSTCRQKPVISPTCALPVERAQNGERSAAAGATLVLPYKPPYDWDAMIGFLGARAIAGIEHVDDAARYTRTVALDGAHGVVTVEPHFKGRASTAA